MTTYYLEVNINAMGENDRFILKVRDNQGCERTLYTGSADRCSKLATGGMFGDLSPDDFVSVDKACVSYFYDENGTQLTALVTPDHKVYLGRRDDYDNRGHYFAKNYPLIFVSNNEDAFDLVAGPEGPFSRREMQEKNAFALGELAAFLQLGLFTRL